MIIHLTVTKRNLKERNRSGHITANWAKANCKPPSENQTRITYDVYTPAKGKSDPTLAGGTLCPAAQLAV